MSILNYDNMHISFKSYDEGKACFYKKEKGWNISYGVGGVNSDIYYANGILHAVVLLLEYNVSDYRISEFFDILNQEISEEDIANLNKYLHTEEKKFKSDFANEIFKRYKGYSRRRK